jgi:hypothetical protein
MKCGKNIFVKPILQMKENRKKERRKIGGKEGRREGEKQKEREKERKKFFFFRSLEHLHSEMK